jgi:hypothetical protein
MQSPYAESSGCDEIGFAARQKSFDALNMIFLDRSETRHFLFYTHD